MVRRGVSPASALMFDRGLFLSRQAIRRQLAAMPHDLYMVRLIHHVTRSAFPGERLWTAAQLGEERTIRFLRVRNREGCDVYIQPYAEGRNAGYVLLDLDHVGPHTVVRMRANGHEPCVLLQTSPGHLQAWIRVSATPLEPTLAGAIGKALAHNYGGDLASSDWRHLGRLAGFTNQKPGRRQGNGYAPWVRLVHAQFGWATQGTSLVQAAQRQLIYAPGAWTATGSRSGPPASDLTALAGSPQACKIYQAWLHRLRIPQRFPQPDWSIADKWIAKELLRQGTSTAAVVALLRQGSPGFPRGHAHPEDYLRRTLTRAFSELQDGAFPAPCAPCVLDWGPS
ncbi:MAG TPA: DNA-primase RepB domain-containing protein [Candidatus Acidoferrales bacterium]|nr:DNA-primase RepB domain-containing protein [Candidatus Acidoferrales bacterium]